MKIANIIANDLFFFFFLKKSPYIQGQQGGACFSPALHKYNNVPSGQTVC